MVASGAGAVAGYVVTGPAGALTGAIVGNAAGPAFLGTWKMSQDAFVSRFRRGEAVIEVAAGELRMTPDELVDLVGTDPARIELVARIIEAAGRTTMEPKIRALGRVLALGLLDDTRVDEAIILADALGDLEAPHVHMLRHMNDVPSPASSHEPSEVVLVGWKSDELATALPSGYRSVIPALLSSLQRHGLVDEPAAGAYGGGGASRFAPTDLGRTCLDLLVGASGGP